MTSYNPNHLQPYTPDDLARLLDFVGRCNLAAEGCGLPHPGDLLHYMSNILRGGDPTPFLRLYDDPHDGLLALIVLYAKDDAFDLVVHPEHRGGDFEAALLAEAVEATLAIMRAEDSEGDFVGSDVMDCETIRADLLRAQGFAPAPEPRLYYTMRDLSEPIPDSALPEGFTIRSAAGEHEAGALAEVHSGAFDSDWTPDAYRAVMRTPGFHIERELVVVAPDGRLAAFCVYWIDPVSKLGLFEPVGCHRDFQKRGLTKALLYEGMRRMAAHGMTSAVVKHEPPEEDPAPSALYASVGFTHRYTVLDYRRPFIGNSSDQ